MPSINWFSPNEMLTYNCLFNFVVGDRGGGKSFGTLEFVINRFIKTGEQFIYLRRWEKEIDESIPTLFDYLKKEGKFKDNELKSSKKGLYCDGKQMGFSVALSTSLKKKSVAYPNVKWIIFEEFMLNNVGHNRYISPGEGEVTIFENFYETVDRLRDETRVIFIGNAFSTVNIYFTRFNIRLTPPYKRYNKRKNIMVCLWQDESYREAKRQTAFYDIVKGGEYAQHAYENKFYLDTTDFIKKKARNSEFSFALTYLNKQYGVWVDWDNGKYYVNKQVGTVPARKNVSLTLDDNKPNNVNIRRVKSMPFMSMFRRAVDENNVYYDKLETYSMLKEAVFLLKTTS